MSAAVASRSLDDLHQRVKTMALALTAACRNAGIDLLVYCTLRNAVAQAELYAQGRSKPGRVVTNARAGESFHNYGLAFDCAPLVLGKADWSSKRWPEIGSLGEGAGLEWAGRWSGRLKETAHFQWSGGLSIAELKTGRMPE